MATGDYDIITVGGGLGGAALAKVMVEHGARVLVLERETQFKDRVRGEAIMPWGVAETKKLGIYDLVLSTCAHELPWWDRYAGTAQIGHQDLVATTRPALPALALFHPTMQEALLAAAAKAGAQVRRGARVSAVTQGASPCVVVEGDGGTEELTARLIVGVDGRSSMVRKWAGFDVQRDPEMLLVSGLLFENTSAPEDTATMVNDFSAGTMALLFPQGGGRVRAYFICRADTELRLQGEADVPRLIEESLKTGVPAEVFAGATPIGPLATFDGADTWVEHPYRQGVALVGDAAASSDPTWGQGLSLTLRDVRVLTDRLRASEDWDEAGHAYAQEHDRYYGVAHAVSNWMSELMFGSGAEAEARRGRAFPLIMQDPSRMPDTALSGPDMPLDEAVRRRMFGEE